MSYTILRRVMALPMSGTQKWVLAVLADFADKDGICFPHVASIAERAGVSRPTVQRALAWLEERGHIVRELRCAEGKGSVYTITAPALAQERENANDAPPHQIDAPPHQIDAPPHQIDAPHASKRCTPSAPPIVEYLTKDLTVQGTSSPPLPPASGGQPDGFALEAKPANRKRNSVPEVDMPEGLGIDAEEWAELLMVCRKKGKPLTRIRWNRIVRNAADAGMKPHEVVSLCAGEGWASYKPKYNSKPQQSGAQNNSGYKSVWQRREEEAQKWIKPKPKTPQGVIIDVTPANREQFTLLEKTQ